MKRIYQVSAVFFSIALMVGLFAGCQNGLAPQPGQSEAVEAELSSEESPTLTSIRVTPSGEAGDLNVLGRSAGSAGNDYPIILLHGFAGWGEDEMLGYNYWGGLVDLKSYLTGLGHDTRVATVGPFSSNWDRACELYAFIKGGRVDYGKVHSEENSHDRYGRTFPGIYPEWSEENPIHIISHSMGGQTMRVLIHLLEEGSREERQGTSSQELSPLFQGGHSWVMSGTSVATPHDGTTLTGHVLSLIPIAQELMALVSSAADGNFLYDFKLDQWGLTRRSGESYSAFADRVWNSSFWEGTNDICTWDLSPEGARELNSWVSAAPNVYYFSIANQCTNRGWFTGYHYPKIYMNPALQPFATMMGREWTRSRRETDGVVNTNSMDGPDENSSDTIVAYDGTPRPGEWNFMGVQKGWDHLAIVGQNVWSVKSLYREMAEVLHELPAR